MKNLISIPAIKKSLYEDWALRVKKRDGFKCVMCGSSENLTSHHWAICDHYSGLAKYEVCNGATLCYSCHIHKIHERADLQSVYELEKIVLPKTGYDNAQSLLSHLESVRDVDVKNCMYRTLYKLMQERTIAFYDGTDDKSVLKEEYRIRKSKTYPHGYRIFITGVSKNQIAVAGNVFRDPRMLQGEGMLKSVDRFEVFTVYRNPDGKYVYGIEPFDCQDETKKWDA